MMTEAIALELKTDSNKIKWLLFTTILLALINLVINKSTPPMGSHQSTSVITSEAAARTAGALPSNSHRDYYLVSEVALREGKSERTIIEWIEAGRIQPTPIKTGKEWRIAEEYRIPPQLAASSGTDTPEAQP